MSKTLPLTGTSRDEVLGRLRALHTDDAKWKDGRTFSLVYFAGDEVSQLLKDAYSEFIAENGLSPLAFPSLRQMECEVVSMAASILGGDDDAQGTMTSGGTESIMMAIKAAREFGRKEKNIKRPHVIIPASAHPAFDKALHYFDVDFSHAPLSADFRVNVAEMEKLIRPETVLLVGSAVAYPQGVVDDIEAIAKLAKSRGLLCHVDACLGGFFLPFAKKAGAPIPPFDLSVDGVTSISADLHKYGYAAKGASVVLYKSGALRRHQFFTYSGWNGGLYASPSFCGTRPGGAIAAAWAVMNFLGEDGYVKRAKQILESSKTMQTALRDAGLKILGEPVGSVFAFTSDSVNVYELGDAMDARGWKLDRQMNPPALHVMVTPAHQGEVLQKFLDDAKDCVSRLKAGEPAPDGSAAMYGMVGQMADLKEANSFLLDFLDGIFSRA